MEQKLTVSSSPHIKSRESVSSVMLDVIVALVPASVAGIYFFGIRALAVILTAVAACMLSEYLYEKITNKPVTVGDLSCVVTGILLALNLPVTIPLWQVVIGSAFAIVIVKQLYGGLGKNFMNPALAARCFMLVAWAGSMSRFTMPFMGYGADAISSATPLAVLKGISEGGVPSVLSAFLGVKAGCIGETSGLMLLIGFVYLLIKKIADWKIPVCYILTFSIFTFLFGTNKTGFGMLHFTLLEVLTGGLLIGAFFMATDYVTTPATFKGRIIFGIGCGFLTFAIRKFGSYPEGVSFSIILMNVAAPLIERYTMPKPFGRVKAGKE